MAESEIPEDIMDVAFHLTAGDWNQPHDVRAKKVAAAINEERGRCARVASKLSQLYKPHLIATAIREPWKFDKMVEFYEEPAIRQDNPNETEQGNG